jgi:IPT/TIG domain
MNGIGSKYIGWATGLLLAVSIGACKVQTYPPGLGAVFPSQGSIGQEITVVGVQFGTSPTVTFQDAENTYPAEVKGSTGDQARALVPRVLAGRVQVRVGTEQGVSDPLSFTVLQPPPVLAAFTPANGLPGTVVTLTGDFLNSVRAVRFGTTAVTSLTAVSARELRVTVPPGLPRGPTQLTIETPTGSQTGDFVVAATPQITDFSPKRTRVGATVLIQGRNLTDAVIRIGGQPTDRSQTIFTDTEVRTVVPPNAVSGRITATVFDRLVATSADGIELVPTPAIVSQNMTEGIRGDKVTLTGRNLGEINSVSVGNVAAVFRLVGDTQLDLTIPDQTQSAETPITISGPGGSATSPQPFLTYLVPAGLTIDPVRQVPGKDITIRGQNLFRITEIRIGGRLMSISGRTEGTDIRATVPADAVNGPLTVTNRAGTGQPAQALTVVQKFGVSDFTPKTGKVASDVVISGLNLTDVMEVHFSAGKSSPAKIGSRTATSMTVTVPADALDGPICLTNETGTICTTPWFFVTK